MAPARDTIAPTSTVAPPPWDLRGRAWIIPYSAPGKKLPADAYPVMDRGTSYADEAVNGAFKGGMGLIYIIRYTATDVGPYDELIFIPGEFESPVTGAKTHPRITTIYVSTEVSVQNGRRNWAIPKHVADFTFSPYPGARDATRVTVSLPGGDAPFFSAILTPARFIPSVPLYKWVPLGVLVQPPLDGEQAEWVGTEPRFASWVRVSWVQPALEGARTGDAKRLGDGVHYPDCHPGSVAFEMTNFDGLFPEGKVLKAT